MKHIKFFKLFESEKWPQDEDAQMVKDILQEYIDEYDMSFTDIGSYTDVKYNNSVCYMMHNPINHRYDLQILIYYYTEDGDFKSKIGSDKIHKIYHDILPIKDKLTSLGYLVDDIKLEIGSRYVYNQITITINYPK